MRQRESGRYTKEKRDSEGKRKNIGKGDWREGGKIVEKGGKANKGRTVAWL